MKHNSYFDGNVQSLSMDTKLGDATVGVMKPGKYTFSTEKTETMEITDGVLKVKLPEKDWEDFERHNQFTVEANQTFEVEAVGDVAYICYYK